MKMCKARGQYMVLNGPRGEGGQEVGWGRVKGRWVCWYGGVVAVVVCREGCGSGVGGEGG